jgi:hypothetical protein
VPVEGVVVLALDRRGIGLAEAPHCSCRADLGPLHSAVLEDTDSVDRIRRSGRHGRRADFSPANQ